MLQAETSLEGCELTGEVFICPTSPLVIGMQSWSYVYSTYNSGSLSDSKLPRMAFVLKWLALKMETLKMIAILEIHISKCVFF